MAGPTRELETYLEAVTDAGTPTPVTSESVREAALYLEAVTDAGTPPPVASESARLGEVYLEALSDAVGPMVPVVGDPVGLGEVAVEVLTDAPPSFAPVVGDPLQLSEVYVEVLTSAAPFPLLIELTDGITVADVVGTYEQLVKADGATFHWRLDQAVGRSLVDEIQGLGVSTEVSVARQLPAAAPMIGNYACGLSNNNGWTYIGFNGHYLMDSPSTLSMEGWFKLPSVSSLFGQRSMVMEADGNSGLSVYVDGDGHLNGMYVSLNRSVEMGPGAIRVDDSVWHHVVITHDFPNGQAHLYLDGQLHLTGVVDTAPRSGSWFSHLGEYFGSYRGAWDEFALYHNVVLTPAQVQNHYRVAVLQHESFRAAILAPLAETASAADSLTGGPAIRLSDHATVADPAAKRIRPPAGVVVPAAPVELVTGTAVSVGYVRVGGAATASLDPLDTGTEVRFAPVGLPVAPALDPIASTSAVHVGIQAASPVLPEDVVTGSAVFIRPQVGGDSSDTIPTLVTGGGDTVVGDNPPINLALLSTARIQVSDTLLEDDPDDPTLPDATPGFREAYADDVLEDYADIEAPQ